MSDGRSKLEAIKSYIREERPRRGIVDLGKDLKPEISGISLGEDGDIRILIDRQLLTTHEGYGGWTELDDPRTLDAVYKIVSAELKRKG